MNDFDLNEDNCLITRQIVDYSDTLNRINYELNQLSRIKEEVEKRLYVLLEHGDDHRKTYRYNRFRITVTTGFNYRLDKKLYEKVRNEIPDSINPVKEKISYEIDKKSVERAYESATQIQKMLLGEVITKTPKKIHVSISSVV